jgi:hypothetical protein
MGVPEPAKPVKEVEKIKSTKEPIKKVKFVELVEEVKEAKEAKEAKIKKPEEKEAVIKEKTFSEIVQTRPNLDKDTVPIRVAHKERKLAEPEFTKQQLEWVSIGEGDLVRRVSRGIDAVGHKGEVFAYINVYELINTKNDTEAIKWVLEGLYGSLWEKYQNIQPLYIGGQKRTIRFQW